MRFSRLSFSLSSYTLRTTTHLIWKISRKPSSRASATIRTARSREKSSQWSSWHWRKCPPVNNKLDRNVDNFNKKNLPERGKVLKQKKWKLFTRRERVARELKVMFNEIIRVEWRRKIPLFWAFIENFFPEKKAGWVLQEKASSKIS